MLGRRGGGGTGRRGERRSLSLFGSWRGSGSAMLDWGFMRFVN